MYREEIGGTASSSADGAPGTRSRRDSDCPDGPALRAGLFDDARGVVHPEGLIQADPKPEQLAKGLRRSVRADNAKRRDDPGTDLGGIPQTSLDWDDG